MSIVLTNGEYYIVSLKNGKIGKTKDIDKAQKYSSCNRAMKKVFKAPSACKGYYPYDTEDIEWNKPRIKQNRKKFSSDERKIIYKNADGKCQLCGRNIDYENMTLDHITPISQGGADDLENIQCTCEACNLFKSNILPAKFFDRITEIFMYQMEKKYGFRNEWKMARNLLMQIL